MNRLVNGAIIQRLSVSVSDGLKIKQINFYRCCKIQWPCKTVRRSLKQAVL